MTTSSSRSTEHLPTGLEFREVFEKAWPEIQTFRNRTAFLTALITATLTASVIWLTIENKEFLILIALVFPAFVIVRGNHYVQQKVSEKLRPSLAAAIGLEHDANDSDVDLPLGLLPHFNQMKTKNAFTGISGQWPFLSVEVTVQDKQERHVKGGARETRTRSYFMGLCVVVKDLPRADPLIVTKDGKGLLGGGPLLSDLALKEQIDQLTGHKFKKVEPDAAHASDLNLYIPKASNGRSSEIQDFLRRLTRVEELLGKKDRLYSVVRTEHEAAIAIMTWSDRAALGGLLITRQKLLTQMDCALQDLAQPFRLVEALMEAD